MNTSKIEYELAEDEVLSIRDIQAGRVVYCLSGMLWLTQDGDSRDHVLGPGGMFRFERPGRVVVAALKRSHMVVTSREEIDLLEALKSSMIGREEVA
jgi:hypothetical protein